MPAALRVYQTPLLDLHVYVAPGVYSDGSPVMLYGDGVFCGLPCSDTLGVNAGHASLGAPVEQPCAIEAEAMTVDNMSRVVFMAQGLRKSQDEYCALLYQH